MWKCTGHALEPELAAPLSVNDVGCVYDYSLLC